MSHQSEVVGDEKRMEGFLALFACLERAFGAAGRELPSKAEVLDIFCKVRITLKGSFGQPNDIDRLCPYISFFSIDFFVTDEKKSW